MVEFGVGDVPVEPTGGSGGVEDRNDLVDLDRLTVVVAAEVADRGLEVVDEEDGRRIRETRAQRRPVGPVEIRLRPGAFRLKKHQHCRNGEPPTDMGAWENTLGSSDGHADLQEQRFYV